MNKIQYRREGESAVTPIDINNPDWYRHKSTTKFNERTRQRLEQLVSIGIEVIGYGAFGKPGVVSGLYIEKVWHLNDKDWEDYFNWLKKLCSPTP